MTILCLIFSKIIRITLNMAAIFLNGFQNGGYKGIVYSAILFSEIYSPQNIYMESILKALRLLVSEIDFGNGRHF